MNWPNKKIAGNIYDLRHLHPFILSVTPKTPGSRAYNVRVTFGCHCFTKELDGTETPDLVFKHGADVRCFCIIRHALSVHLPNMVRDSASRKVAFAAYGGNYFVAKTDIPGLTDPYAAFFYVAKAKNPDFDVLMEVISAYPKSNLPKHPGLILFTTLIGKTIRGERVTEPKK